MSGNNRTAGVLARRPPLRYLLALTCICLALSACLPRTPLLVTPTDPFSGTAQPGSTPTTLPIPTGQQIEIPGPCSNNSQFITDTTIPDGTQIAPGAPIDKRWSVLNNGTCDWGPDYSLVLISGSDLGSGQITALFPARAGAEVEIQLTLTAPFEPGEYTSTWQMRDSQSQLFGDTLFINFVVNVAP